MTVKVGIPVSLTGRFSLQGFQTLAGIRGWADYVNGTGGLKIAGSARTVELVWHEDRSRRDSVGVITERLILNDRVDLLVGPYSAVLTNTAAEIARAHDKLLWNQGGASPLVYQQGNPWVVGVLTPADEYLRGLLPAIREVCPGASTVGIVRASTGAFPRDVASGVEQSAGELGFRNILDLQFDPEAEDFGDAVSRICEVSPDVLVVVGRFQNDLRLAELLAVAGPKVGVMAVVAAGVAAFREHLGPMSENFMGPSQWEPDAGFAIDYGPSVVDVKNGLRRAGQPVIDYPMAQAYAVGVVIQRCVEECGSLDDAGLREAAAWLDFTTFYGRFRIDAATGRQVGKRGLLVQWQNGRKSIVWPPELRTAGLVHPWR